MPETSAHLTCTRFKMRVMPLCIRVDQPRTAPLSLPTLHKKTTTQTHRTNKKKRRALTALFLHPIHPSPLHRHCSTHTRTHAAFDCICASSTRSVLWRQAALMGSSPLVPPSHTHTRRLSRTHTERSAAFCEPIQISPDQSAHI